MVEQHASARDLVDGISGAWERELLSLSRPEFDLVRRGARLGVLLEEKLCATLKPWRLTRADYGLLSTLRLAGPPYELRPSDLRARLLLTSGGVSNVINRLERLGAVEREQDGSDGRQWWVRLTPSGLGLATEIMTAWAAAQQDLLAKVPQRTWEQASVALREVLLALGDREAPAAGNRSRHGAGEAKLG